MDVSIALSKKCHKRLSLVAKKSSKNKKGSQILLKQELKMYLGMRKKVTMKYISLLGILIQKYVACWVLLSC